MLSCVGVCTCLCASGGWWAGPRSQHDRPLGGDGAMPAKRVPSPERTDGRTGTNERTKTSQEGWRWGTKRSKAKQTRAHYIQNESSWLISTWIMGQKADPSFSVVPLPDSPNSSLGGRSRVPPPAGHRATIHTHSSDAHTTADSSLSQHCKPQAGSCRVNARPRPPMDAKWRAPPAPPPDLPRINKGGGRAESWGFVDSCTPARARAGALRSPEAGS